MWIPRLGEPFEDPPGAQIAGINLPQCWAASARSEPSFLKCQIRPCRVIRTFGKRRSGAALDPVALHLRSSTGKSRH